MARDLVISHGRLGNEARKVLAGQDLKASCYRCHDLKPIPGAEKAWQGFQLFSTNAVTPATMWMAWQEEGMDLT